MAERKSFTFFISYWEAIEELPEKEQLPVLKAIIKYAFFGEEPKFKGIKQAVFLLVKPTLDKSKQKAANGKQGGSKPKANRKQTASDISEDKEEDKGKGIGIGIGIGVGGGTGEQAPPLPDSDFEIFFSQYPVGIAKDAALDAWMKLPQDTSLLDILDSLDAWKLSKQWKDQGGRYIPRAAKWLSEGHWRTMPKPAENEEIPKGASGQLGQAELEAIRRTMSDGGYRFDEETGSWVGPELEGK
jgi:hypothetical protein